MYQSSCNHSSPSADNAINSIFQYIENYIDLVENLPNEIIREITQLHEKNHIYYKLNHKLEELFNILFSKNETDQDNKDDKDENDNENVQSKEKNDADKKSKALLSLQKSMLDIQELLDEKLCIMQTISDHLEFKNKQLEHDFRMVSANPNNVNLKNNINVNNLNKNLEDHANNNGNSENYNQENGYIKESVVINNNQSNSVNNLQHYSTNPKRSSSRRNLSSNKNDNSNLNELSNLNSNNNNVHSKTNSGNGSANYTSNTGKRGVKRGVKTGKQEIKKNKSLNNQNNKNMLNNSPSLYDDTPIDPDEPTYCSCEQVSFGEMICCDNASCLIEWFHFSCVSLTTKPKGKWYCPNCRGDRSNIPKK